MPAEAEVSRATPSPAEQTPVQEEATPEENEDAEFVEAVTELVAGLVNDVAAESEDDGVVDIMHDGDSVFDEDEEEDELEEVTTTRPLPLDVAAPVELSEDPSEDEHSLPTCAPLVQIEGPTPQTPALPELLAAPTNRKRSRMVIGGVLRGSAEADDDAGVDEGFMLAGAAVMSPKARSKLVGSAGVVGACMDEAAQTAMLPSEKEAPTAVSAAADAPKAVEARTPRGPCEPAPSTPARRRPRTVIGGVSRKAPQRPSGDEADAEAPAAISAQSRGKLVGSAGQQPADFLDVSAPAGKPPTTRPKRPNLTASLLPISVKARPGTAPASRTLTEKPRAQLCGLEDPCSPRPPSAQRRSQHRPSIVATHKISGLVALRMDADDNSASDCDGKARSSSIARNYDLLGTEMHWLGGGEPEVLVPSSSGMQWMPPMRDLKVASPSKPVVGKLFRSMEAPRPAPKRSVQLAPLAPLASAPGL